MSNKARSFSDVRTCGRCERDARTIYVSWSNESGGAAFYVKGYCSLECLVVRMFFDPKKAAWILKEATVEEKQTWVERNIPTIREIATGIKVSS
jgi:hypothetical protein